MVKFSLLIPTRDRVDLVNRLFQSIVDTTLRLDEVEAVLCLDEDDSASSSISHDTLAVTKFVVRKGLPMGALNRACFEASHGRYVMLMNDDVILRTPGWDATVSAVFDSFRDDIALVHVNDLLFREKLCTFPILSRRACLQIGICPEIYRRYRIDDHIYDTYQMLSYLGHKRIVYLDDVIFEHDNYAHVQGGAEHHFKSKDNKIYLPAGPIIEKDAADFVTLQERRKQDALLLASLIDERANAQKKASYQALLGNITDSTGYRTDDLVRKLGSTKGDWGSRSSVTVAVVTSDIRRRYARKCLSLIKKYTKNFELIILDNNRSKDFNHPREMNKVLQGVKTDFLVLMDDDVYVEPNWLEGLLECVDDDTGIVTPLHRDRSGNISYAGVYLKGDGTGEHAHILDVPAEPRTIPCICSAVVLIDMKKCGAIRFDTAYRKYFLDLDYSLQVWEAGYKVVCASRSIVTHLGGATMSYSSAKGAALYKRDEAIFIETWVRSGRLAEVESRAWSSLPFINAIMTAPNRIEEAFAYLEKKDFDEIKADVENLLEIVGPLRLFHKMLERHLQRLGVTYAATNDQAGVDFFRAASDRLTSRSVVHGTVRLLAEKCLHAPLANLKTNQRARALAALGVEILKRAFDRYRYLPDSVRRVLDAPVQRLINLYHYLHGFVEAVTLAETESTEDLPACDQRGTLFICTVSAEKARQYVKELDITCPTLLLPKGRKELAQEFSSILCRDLLGRESDLFDISCMSPEVIHQIKAHRFDRFVIPYEGRIAWGDVTLEKLTEKFTDSFAIIFPDGTLKNYDRYDDLNRIIYNKVYIGSMFRYIPKPESKDILDVGCSDGMVCDLLLNEKPRAVVGVDITEAVGCNYLDSRIKYLKMDAMELGFENAVFDLTFSIATLEHCGDPIKALNEMKRVTRNGGHCYVQAGPLYHSPYGHHMFGYFDDFPWIHLRMSKEQIVRHCRENRIDVKIERNTGLSVEEYIFGMLNQNHVNMKLLAEYQLVEFMASNDINVLNFSRSYEGTALLTGDIKEELKRFSVDDLTAHGFELAFQVL